MKSYFLSIAATALIASIVSILSPAGEGGGISRHLKLFTSLLLVCVLISPIGGWIGGIQDWFNGELAFPWEDTEKNIENNNLQDRLDEMSTEYFTALLTETLEREFSIETGDLRCVVIWQSENDPDHLRPERVTLLLSGRAIWKNTEAMEDFVTSLLGCACTSAIE